MIPRVELKAVELFDAGLKFNKYYLAGIAHCDQRTAQRALKKLHENKVITIREWCKVYYIWIPVYGYGLRDKAKPKPLTTKQRYKRYYSNPESAWKSAMKKRAKRLILKHSTKQTELLK